MLAKLDGNTKDFQANLKGYPKGSFPQIKYSFLTNDVMSSDASTGDSNVSSGLRFYHCRR